MKRIPIKGIVEEAIGLISFLTTVLKFSGDDEVKIAAWVFLGLDGLFLLSYIIHWALQWKWYGTRYQRATEYGTRAKLCGDVSSAWIEVLDDVLADAGTAIMSTVMVINQAKRDHKFTFKLAATTVIVLLKNLVKIGKHVAQLLENYCSVGAGATMLRRPTRATKMQKYGDGGSSNNGQESRQQSREDRPEM